MVRQKEETMKKSRRMASTVSASLLPDGFVAGIVAVIALGIGS